MQCTCSPKTCFCFRPFHRDKFLPHLYHNGQKTKTDADLQTQTGGRYETDQRRTDRQTDRQLDRQGGGREVLPFCHTGWICLRCRMKRRRICPAGRGTSHSPSCTASTASAETDKRDQSMMQWNCSPTLIIPRQFIISSFRWNGLQTDYHS